MEIKEVGRLFYFEINLNQKISKDYFSFPKYVNSNKNLIKEFHINKDNAIALTNNNELIQWSKEQIINNSIDNINNINYLSEIPSYIYNKIKFKSISINSSICLALDNQSKVMVWGVNANGLLGLGFHKYP